MKSITMFACLIVLMSLISVLEGRLAKDPVIIIINNRKSALTAQSGSKLDKKDLFGDLNRAMEDEDDSKRSLADDEQAFDWDQ